ncbi:hypothetical protein ACTXT7_005261 [Hymenolepis weldensis]
MFRSTEDVVVTTEVVGVPEEDAVDVETAAAEGDEIPFGSAPAIPAEDEDTEGVVLITLFVDVLILFHH